jgi:hypothetical protein
MGGDDILGGVGTVAKKTRLYSDGKDIAKEHKKSFLRLKT